jgi:hypothetical protein
LAPRFRVAARVRDIAYQGRLRGFSFTVREVAPGGSDKRDVPGLPRTFVGGQLCAPRITLYCLSVSPRLVVRSSVVLQTSGPSCTTLRESLLEPFIKGTMSPVSSFNSVDKCALPFLDPDGNMVFFNVQSAEPGTFTVPGVVDLETYEPGSMVETSWIYFKGDPQAGPQPHHPFERPFNDIARFSMLVTTTPRKCCVR